MKKITLEQYEKEARSLVFDVMAAGDIVEVDCGDAGSFVIMEGPEYQVLRDALEMLITLGSSGLIPDDVLRRFSRENG